MTVSQPHKRWRLVVAAAYTAALTYLLLAPHPEWLFGPKAASVAKFASARDHIIHGATLTVFTVLWIWATSSARTKASWRCLAAGVAFGIVTELLQGLVPERYCDWRDMVADSIGAAAGWLLAELIGSISAFWARSTALPTQRD